MPHHDKIQFLFSANNFGIAHFVHFCSLIVIGLPENLKICFQIRILRVNNTYLTYTMDLHPGRRSPGF